jgi:hypothetical protein
VLVLEFLNYHLQPVHPGAAAAGRDYGKISTQLQSGGHHSVTDSGLGEEGDSRANAR